MTEIVNRTDSGSQAWITAEDNGGNRYEMVAVNLAADGAAPSFWVSAALADTLSRTMTVPYVGAATLLDDGSNLIRARGNTLGQYVQGSIATDSAISTQNPLYNGGRASDVPPTAVAAGDVAATWHSLNGALNQIQRWDHLPVTATPTIDTAVYADLDRLGSVVTIANAGLANGRGGLITNPRVVDDADSNFSITAYFFKVSPTIASADNAAFDITDANIATALYIGAIDFLSANTQDWATNRNTYGTVMGAAAPLGYLCDAAATSIYMVCRARGAYDAAATDDLVFHFDLLRF